MPISLPTQPVKYAVICSSNQNRSMEAHLVLNRRHLNVRSFGTGTAVRLPGESQDRPNIYDFGTPYDFIYHDLESKNRQLYTSNGLLRMLDRNRKIKTAPERFQDNRDLFAVIITCEARVWDAVCDDLAARGGVYNVPVHVVNFEIKDNVEEAGKGAQAIAKMTDMIEKARDLDADMEDIVTTTAKTTGFSLLHTICYCAFLSLLSWLV
ncbi:RNA polymerase II subunit A C-terminal domain phosphatase SSU72-like protein [Hyaloraphidium curvatum]|nr:RNA polymerase II subunit A C-terminal domain phosphatase SSU72-like protein [Hyaloraphidium curvatum]